MTETKTPQSSLVLPNPFKPAFLGPRYWGTWLAIGILFVLYLLPISWSDALASKLGDLARNINAKRRRIARINLQMCLPELSDEQRKQLLHNHFRAQMRSVLHLGIVWWGSKKYLQNRIILHGQEHIEQTLARGKSVIIMAGHCVGLDAAGSSILMRYPVTGPIKLMRNSLINYFIVRGRARYGTIIYSRDAGLRPIIKDVRAGHIMFYLSDEDLGRERSIFAPLFGHTKATIPVLGRLAKSCNAEVLPLMGCYDYEKHQYQVHVLPALENFPRGDDLIDATIMNQSIETLVRLCPVEYFWTFRLFNTRPEGEAKIY
ncbi:MAG: lipid A biosynthesis acyltransferase [Gammaproteobacteria bacterium]|nr:lipid A biosynthesis acyltransferase [Gammaproteobacteria bacterium]